MSSAFGRETPRGFGALYVPDSQQGAGVASSLCLLVLSNGFTYANAILFASLYITIADLSPLLAVDYPRTHWQKRPEMHTPLYFARGLLTEL